MLYCLPVTCISENEMNIQILLFIVLHLNGMLNISPRNLSKNDAFTEKKIGKQLLFLKYLML